MNRRDFISVLGGADAWPLAARAQQPAMPMVGFVTGLSSNYVTGRKPAFRRGLREVGYVEGQNVAIARGYVESLARPGGNATGFATMEVSVIGKMLQTLKEIAPNVAHVSMIFNPDNPGGLFVRSFESAAGPLGVEHWLPPRGCAPSGDTRIILA
jgi:hypothetical protein